jgi:hypothetical protein
MGRQGLLGRVRLRVRHGGDGPIDGQRVAQLGDAANRGHGVGQDLVGLGLTVGGLAMSPPPAATGEAAPMFVPGHVGEARRQSVMNVPALAAFAPDGPTQTIVGIVAFSSAL